MKRMKKMIPLLTVFIMVFLTVPISTQAQSKKAAVNKTINTFFARAKKLNCKKMEKCFVPAGVVIFDEPASFCNVIRPWSKKMTWKIKSTKISGDRAEATVQVQYRSISKAYFEMWLKTSYYEVEEPKKSQAKIIWLKKYEMNLLRECLKKVKPDEITTHLKISLQKKDGKWKISHATDRLLNVVYCDLLRKGKSEEEYVKEIKDIMEKEHVYYPKGENEL